MGTIFALRSRYLTLKNHISGYEKVLDFWKTDLLYWGHTVTFRPQLKKIWDYDFFAWYLHLQIYSKTFRQSVLRHILIFGSSCWQRLDLLTLLHEFSAKVIFSKVVALIPRKIFYQIWFSVMSQLDCAMTILFLENGHLMFLAF